MKEYYDLRAPYYDDWWIGAARDRPGWQEELEQALAAIAALPPARTLDVACGTGYLTQHLGGDVVGLDQSARMLAEARRRLPERDVRPGRRALRCRSPDGAFERIFTSYFYCHLVEEERVRFLERGAPRRAASSSSWAAATTSGEPEPSGGKTGR